MDSPHIESYACCIVKREFDQAIIVFGGYHNSPTKHMTHTSGRKSWSGRNIHDEMRMTAKEEVTVLVGDVTDLTVRLCFYADINDHDLFMHNEVKSTTKKNRVKDQLGYMCDNILFIHAILRCDTTAQLYGLGKGISQKKLGSSQHFQRQFEQFGKHDASTEHIVATWERALVCLYNGKPEDSLDS